MLMGQYLGELLRKAGKLRPLAPHPAHIIEQQTIHWTLTRMINRIAFLGLTLRLCRRRDAQQYAQYAGTPHLRQMAEFHSHPTSGRPYKVVLYRRGTSVILRNIEALPA